MNRFSALAIGLSLAFGEVASGQFGDSRFEGFPVPSPALSTDGTPGGWYGGDSGFMIPLDDNTMFWTFADVYIGAKPIPGARSRAGAAIGITVGNTIALVKRDPTTQATTTTHYFRGSPTPDSSGGYSQGPFPFFSAPNVAAGAQNKNNGDRLWPHKAFLLDGSLYIFTYLLNTENNKYTITQTVIVKVTNPYDPPPSWKITYLYLGQNTGRQVPAYYGAEAFYVQSPDPTQNYLFTYGVYCSDYTNFFNKFQILALRIPLDRLKAAPDGADLAPVAEFMTKAYGTWRPLPLDPTNFFEVGNATNFAYQSFATRYNKTLGSWQVTFSYDKNIEECKSGSRDPKCRTVWVARGAGPYGPWEPPVLAYTFPEAAISTPTPGAVVPPIGQLPPDPARMATRSAGGGVYYGKMLSYFARDVPSLAKSDEFLALTYTTDTSEVHVDRFWNLNLYTVQIARPVPNPLLRPAGVALPR